MSRPRQTAAVLFLLLALGLTGCSHTAIYSENGQTSVRGSNMQIYGTINQSYTHTIK